MPYVSQSRTLRPWQFYTVRSVNAGVYETSYENFVPIQSEYTTSYRTGRIGDSRNLEEPPDSIMNRAQFASWLSQDAQTASYSSSYDTGHTFSTEKHLVRMSHPYEIFAGPEGGGHGPLIPACYDYGLGYPSPPSYNESWYGTEAIRRTRPTSPHATLAQALIELKREGIPHIIGLMLWRDRKRPRNLHTKTAEEWLNANFGVSPLARDVSAAVSSLARSRQTLEQFYRDAGKQVRRSMTFPVVEKSSTSVLTNRGEFLYPSNQVSSWCDRYVAGGYGSRFGTITRTVTSSVSVRFSGAYTYAVPADNGLTSVVASSEQKLNQLLGTRLNASTAWEIMPWSWLSDWVGNIGSVISNAESLQEDGLVIRYGYLTVHRQAAVSYTLSGVQVLGHPGPYTLTVLTDRKDRIRATPYGFGLTPGAFSLKQWSILGALGLTRAHGSLRYND